MTLVWNRLFATEPNEALRLDSLITGARLMAAMGKDSEALKKLELAFDDSRRQGFVWLNLEARLAAGEIELKAADPFTARTHLSELVRDAGIVGYRLIAAKAAAELGGRP